MRATIVTVCDKLPAWVKSGFDDYAQRLAHALPLNCIDLNLAVRGKNPDLKRALTDEGTRMLAAVPKNCQVIALDGEGEMWSSEQLAKLLARWRDAGRDLALLIGGPDGLAPSCLQTAQQRWSLGPLTLPHALVRIVLAEQLFRATSILANHPYHRAGRVG